MPLLGEREQRHAAWEREFALANPEHVRSPTAVAARHVREMRGREPAAIHLGEDVEPLVVAQAAFEALVADNDPPAIFVRGGKLTRVLHDEHGRARAELLSRDAIATAVMHAATFTKRRGKTQRAQAEVPRYVAPTIDTLPEWPGLPALAGIVEAPVLRADGSVLQEPGYDPATRLYYRPADGLAVPDVTSQPTPADAADAARLLREELLGDFPFVAEADAADALALLLTPIVRQLVPLAPLALITAPIKGSGKGLLAGVAARIATGAPAAVYAYEHGDESEPPLRPRLARQRGGERRGAQALHFVEHDEARPGLEHRGDRLAQRRCRSVRRGTGSRWRTRCRASGSAHRRGRAGRSRCRRTAARCR